jgi:hypothetical protein
MDFQYLNKYCPKDNFPTPFIDHIMDNYAKIEIFPFMDTFLGYNQIQIHPKDQSKITFIYPCGMFAYRKMPFFLKIVGATF